MDEVRTKKRRRVKGRRRALKCFLIFLFWLLKMDQIFRKVTPQEAYELQSMFPDIRVDYTEFKVFSDNYTQSTKNSCDTKSDTRCEFYIPPKATILKSWSIDCDSEVIDSTGSSVDPVATETVTLQSTPSVIERFHILHGNGAGDILYEITNHAHALFEQKLQGMHDASEYNYFKVTEDEDGKLLVNASQITQVYKHGDDVGIVQEWDTQVAKLQKERQRKYKNALRNVDDYTAAGDNNLGKLTFLSSDILPKKIDYWPHLLSSRGITIRCDLRSDAYHMCPK